MSKKASPSKGLLAGEMMRIFENAKVLTDQLEGAKSEKAKATLMGNFLSQHVNREVPIQHRGRTGVAKLCVDINKSRKTKRYYFEVTFDDGATESETGQSNERSLDDVDDDSRDDGSRSDIDIGDEENAAPVEDPEGPKTKRSLKAGRKSTAKPENVSTNDEQW